MHDSQTVIEIFAGDIRVWGLSHDVIQSHLLSRYELPKCCEASPSPDIITSACHTLTSIGNMYEACVCAIFPGSAPQHDPLRMLHPQSHTMILGPITTQSKPPLLQALAAQSRAEEPSGKPPADSHHTAVVAAVAVEEAVATAQRTAPAFGRAGRPGAASTGLVAVADIAEVAVPVVEEVADALAARGQLALASRGHSGSVRDTVALSAEDSGTGMVPLQAEHWATQAGFGPVVGSKRMRSGHLSELCRPTREHWVAAEGGRDGSFEG